MRPLFAIPVWKNAPFLRLLLPLIIGILLEYHFNFPPRQVLSVLLPITMLIAAFSLLPLRYRYVFKVLLGAGIQCLLSACGALLLWQKDVRNHPNWYGNNITDSSFLLIRIDEPLVERPRSYKAAGKVRAVLNAGKIMPYDGKLILYFYKDSSAPALKYGDQVWISKQPQRISHTGNPGAFDYSRYAGNRQIFYNVFLEKKDWVQSKQSRPDPLWRFIYNARDEVLYSLQQFIKGKQELGVAEALLIGFKEDLDKDLVAAYTNTGVVHIIAISGLHLGLIYAMLIWIFKKIPWLKKSRLLTTLLILSFLWIFSLLTGASASVLRSAVMFTCIAIGELLTKKSSIYNSLAASAFLLLCYDPYFLWDLGFQLSYLALTGILVFQQPVYRLWYIKNKWLAKCWGLVAVSLAAQVFTFPACMFYFHQFPRYFLLSNIFAVPLSSLALFAEIVLVSISWVPFVAGWLGKALTGLIWLMNRIIVSINELPLAVWDNISISGLLTLLLYSLIICMSAALMGRHRKLLLLALGIILLMILEVYHKDLGHEKQQKIIVYNVPKHSATGIIQGKNLRLVGDSATKPGNPLFINNIKPSLIAGQLELNIDSLKGLFRKGHFYMLNNTRLYFADSLFQYAPLLNRIPIDLIILSKNTRVTVRELSAVFDCKQFVFDASNSLWKIGKWQAECDELHLPGHSVSAKGAFVLDLNK